MFRILLRFSHKSIWLKISRGFKKNYIYSTKVSEKSKDVCAKPDTEAKTAKAGSRKTFKVYRFEGIASKKPPRMQSFELDTSTCGNMILDVLLKLKDMDPSLTFRRSCREGICGSCAVQSQGSNCLACITPIPDASTVTIYPIPHMYVIRDLVVDMTHFFKGYDSIMPYLIRDKEVKMGTTQYAQSLNDNSKMIGLYECVLCACCSTSCPAYWWNGRRFLGPASLLHAYRWIIDSRDDGTKERIAAINDDFKTYRCHSIFNCCLVCPKGLLPGIHIAKLKRLIAGLDKKTEPDTDPLKYGQAGAGSKDNQCSCK